MCVCVLAATVDAKAVYVNETYNGEGSPTGGLADPYTTIQDAILASFHGYGIFSTQKKLEKKGLRSFKTGTTKR
jgi:hypothetical protein